MLGSDLEKSYSGEDVNEIINIIFEECDQSIIDSYNEGYKQAVLEYKPQLVITENKYIESKKNNFRNCTITCSIGFGVGFAAGCIIVNNLIKD